MMTMMDTDSTARERWAAVCARDARADGTFVFAVRTTGVFCRPQCAARRPLRENVEFFVTVDDARAAGYRPCKRCRPECRSMEDELIAIVDLACRTLEEAETVPSLAVLAAAAGKSPFHFQRTFKRIVGVTPREYAAAKRAEGLRHALPAHARVVDAVYDAGFGSSSRAYSLAAATLGMTPSAYAAGGRGERVRFATGRSDLGWIGVALTARGVAAIELGDSREEVSARINERFAAADVAEDHSELQDVLERVLRYIE